MKARFWRWLIVIDRRIRKRHPVTDVVAYYWDGKIPTGHPVKDINWGGAYLSTDERWRVGTLLMITLQRGEEISDATDFISLPCRVVHHGEEGIGIHFMPTSQQEHQGLKRFVRLVTGSGNPGAASPATKGEAAVEFAVMVPLLFLLIVNAFNFGSFIYCWLTVADAVRAAADYACIDSSTAGSPAAPSVTQLTSLVQNATSGLPDYSGSNPVVTACEYNNGTTTTFLATSSCPAGVTAPPADPEAIASGSSSKYPTVAVDVTYTFTPLLAGSRFLTFGLPSLPSTIHRRTIVRWP